MIQSDVDALSCIFFSIYSLYSCFFLKISTFLLNLSLFMHFFSWFHWIIFLFSNSSLSFLKTIILNCLPGKLQISISLFWLLGNHWSFGGIMWPWVFMFLEVLYCCRHIWRSTHLPHSLLSSFESKIPSFSPVRIRRLFQDVSYGCPCSTVLSPSCRWIIKPVFFLSIL